MTDVPVDTEPAAGPIPLTDEQLAAAQAAADLGILGDASAPPGYMVDPNHVPNLLDVGGIITTEYHGISAYDLPRTYGVFDPTYVPESTAGGPPPPPPAPATDYNPNQVPSGFIPDEVTPDDDEQPPPDEPAPDDLAQSSLPPEQPVQAEQSLPPAVAQAVAEQETTDDDSKAAFAAQAKLHPGASPEELKGYVVEAAQAKAPTPSGTRDSALEATPAAAAGPGEDKVVTEAEGGEGTSK
jgi:hypothetical protein